MGMQPDTKYEATVLDAFLTKSNKKGTDGIFFAFQTEVGRVEHTAWITPATAERLSELLYDCFAITREQLTDEKFLSQLGEKMKGRVVSIVSDEGDSEYGVKVKWMNPAGFTPQRSAPVEFKRVAGIFGGGPASSPAYSNRKATETGPAPAWDGSEEEPPF